MLRVLPLGTIFPRTCRSTTLSSLGASFAGLVTARVLSEHFSQVTLTAAEMGRHMDALAQLGTVDVSVTEALLLSTQLFEPARLRHPDLATKARTWIAEERRPPAWDPGRPPRLAAA